MNKKIIAIILGVLLFDAAVAITGNFTAEENETDDLRVAVTIPPQEQFVKRVGEEKVKVTLMVPPGEEPHSYEPTPRQMRELAKADIYFKLGSQISFERRWMDRLKDFNEDMTIVNGSEGIELRKMGGNIDPHVWMSPRNALTTVKNLKDALIQENPENSDIYKENAEDYISKLEDIHSNITGDMKEYSGEKFMVYHPSFGYFADEYGLDQAPIQKEGKKPGTKGIQEIIDQAKRENISAIFVSPQFDKNRAKTIADEIDGEVITLNPLAKDYLKNMKKMYKRLISAFETDGVDI